jgi:hypothetical protein
MVPSEKYGWHPSSLIIFKLTNIVDFKIIKIIKIIAQYLKIMYSICFLRSVAKMAGGVPCEEPVATRCDDQLRAPRRGGVGFLQYPPTQQHTVGGDHPLL